MPKMQTSSRKEIAPATDAEIDKTYLRGDLSDAIFHESRVVHHWPDLFEVIEEIPPYAPRRRRVFTIGNLSKRQEALTNRYKDDETAAVAGSLLCLRRQYPTGTFKDIQQWLHAVASKTEGNPSYRMRIPFSHLRTIKAAIEIAHLLEEGVGIELRRWPSPSNTKTILQRLESAVTAVGRLGGHPQAD